MDRIMTEWMKNNILVRITVVKRKMGNFVIHGRILEIREDEENLLVYDDDRKELHHLKFNEIDDITPAA